MSPTAPELPLRDIHLPDPVSWWPLAPGWWGLLGLLLLIIGLVFFILRLRRQGRLRRDAAKALTEVKSRYQTDHDGHRLAAELSTLLRRIALSYFPREEVASLTDEAWLNFLDRGLIEGKHSGAFSQGAGRVLIEAPYRPQTAVDGAALLELCTAWINTLPRQPARGRT